ncbi:serine protease filzig-like [Pollicipes pollicipes]|uniref:serine protease filzig-like n=1 Tax=Pollicipes pollicipes TaxID=41117 RepID=UPI001884CD12|nr:serine protease filzig-like [Pollicipes pollicipes]
MHVPTLRPAFGSFVHICCRRQLTAGCRGGDVKDRAIDFFSLLKNHLVPQAPAAPDASLSQAHRTEVRGSCLHEYYAVHAGQPLTVTSTNYPSPYPPSECRKLVLMPAEPGTAVVMVCTDVDTFGTGVLGAVSGDMIEFPGPAVNRRAHTVYGMDALKMGFFSDEFVQRRGFSCQVWGEAVQGGGGPASVGAGFPGQRRRRSLADLLKARILTGARDVATPTAATATTTVASLVTPALTKNGQDVAPETEAALDGINDPVAEDQVAAVSQSEPDLGLFRPPEHIEYIITPLRTPVQYDPEREGNPPMFERRPVDRNTTESPVVEVPYVVTPRAVTLRATTAGGETMTHLLPLRPDQFPTTPRVPSGPQALLERVDVGEDAEDVLTRLEGEESDDEDVPVVLDVANVGAVSGGEGEVRDNAEGGHHAGGGHVDGTVVQENATEGEPAEDDSQTVERVDVGEEQPVAEEVVVTEGFQKEEECGLAGPAVQARVFGGEDALPGSYPWVVYLISDSPRGPEKTTYCTGSLISRRWVLTAAHCVDYARSTTVHMGYLDVSKETNLTLKMEANQYRVHRYWTRLAKDHDVALIELPEPVPVSEHVRPICLPRRSEVGLTFAEARGEICGWGKTYTDQVGGSFVLQRAEMPIKSNCDCMTSFPINITPLKVCTHGRFHSPCQGDSGGPLQVRRDGRYTLVGVSSITSALGCDVGMPAVYSRVTAYLDWIENNSGLVVPL